MGAQLGSEALLQDHSLATKGVLCVWDLSAPVHPKAVLVSEGSPSCCGFCPAPAGHVVFAGMEEGGLCVWDLEEPDARHPVRWARSLDIVVGGEGGKGKRLCVGGGNWRGMRKAPSWLRTLGREGGLQSWVMGKCGSLASVGHKLV
eukprot:184622-Chlamydomonas_euryale.AAC.4